MAISVDEDVRMCLTWHVLFPGGALISHPVGKYFEVQLRTPQPRCSRSAPSGSTRGPEPSKLALVYTATRQQ